MGDEIPQKLEGLLIAIGCASSEAEAGPAFLIQNLQGNRTCRGVETEGLTVLPEKAVDDEVADLSPYLKQLVEIRFVRRNIDVERGLEFRFPVCPRQIPDRLSRCVGAPQDRDQDEDVLRPAEKAFDRGQGIVPCLLSQLACRPMDGLRIRTRVSTDALLLARLGLRRPGVVQVREEHEPPEQ
ncbi:hypothetical protein [Brevundimonas naejangsanensis]|uniref:hypothetical protein n=1 Tax=Brevundimonas naejangsanensis TaxID=588932 RepID=UPI0039F6E0E2